MYIEEQINQLTTQIETLISDTGSLGEWELINKQAIDTIANNQQVLQNSFKQAYDEAYAANAKADMLKVQQDIIMEQNEKILAIVVDAWGKKPEEH